VSEKQVTFDQLLDKKAPEEKGAFLRKKYCTSCGKPMMADEFRSSEDRCYWCRRLRGPSNFGGGGWKGKE